MLLLDEFTEEDSARFRTLSERGIIACFIYSRSYMVNGTLSVFDPDNIKIRTVQKSGVTLVPSALFAALDGASVTPTEHRLTVEYKENRLVCQRDNREYFLNGNRVRFSVECEYKNGCFFVPVIEAALALGLNAKGFNSDRLTVIADKTVLAELSKNERLQYAASCALMGEYDPYSLTHADFAVAKDKWRKTIVGDEYINDITNEETVKKLKSIEQACESSRALINRDPETPILFGAEPPTVSRDLNRQYGHLFNLAMAYGAYGNRFYRDEKLKNDILFGLEWMYLNMYGEAEIEGRGWRDAHLFNWYDWFVGGPDPLTDTMLIMEEHLTDEKKRNYLKALKWVTTIHRVGFIHPHAMSRVVVCTKMALLLEDGGLLADEYKDYELLLALRETDEGPRIDGCEWTHTQPYNMIYGINNLCRVLKVGAILAGTPVEYKSYRQYNLFFLVKYMFEAALYKGQGLVMLDGRDNGSSEMKNGVAILSYILPMIGMFGDDEDAYIKRMIKRNAVRPEFLKRLRSFCSLYNFSLLEDILSDEAVPSNDDFTLGHAWFTGDRAVQHRNGYCIAVAMCSERGRNYESINGANLTGWYTGDGAFYLYTDADSHAYDGVNFITSEQISYMIPGTTVDTQKREAKSIRSAWHMPRSFVGSMAIKGEFVMAAMDYESYHFEGPYDDTPDTGYGGGLPLHNNDLVAKKSWFMLNGECVCLGAGINSTTGFDVNTVIEHRRLVKENETVRGIEDITVDGELLDKCEFKNKYKNVETLNLEGFAGYVFPYREDICVSRYQRVNAPTRCEYFGELGDDGKGKPYFEAHIEHGKNPKDKSYAYIVVPEATEQKLAAVKDNVQILSNTPTLQAVYAKDIGLTSIVFWQAGECSGVKTDTPCLVMLSEENSVLTLSVCDPTQKAKSATLTVSKALKLKSANDRLAVEELDGSVKITVNFEGSYSRNLAAEFTE